VNVVTVVAQLAGVLIFAIGTLVLGIRLRRNPIQASAVSASRTSHFLFYACLVLPGAIGLFEPGLTGYDRILGITPLPYPSLFLYLGMLLFVVGLYLMAASNRALAKLGAGAAAFKLTQRLVRESIYTLVRNPMSLGYYLVCLSLGFMAGSTALSLGVLFLLIPVHVFNLKYFEEKEIEIRLGGRFQGYKETVPFIIPRLWPRPGTGSS
jgi:protein-S-isoprenylcysteine O-methyltransferase Ste14